MTSIEHQTRLSTAAIKEQLKSGSMLVNPDLKFSTAALTAVHDYVRDIYSKHLGQNIQSALDYGKSKTVTDKLLKVIKMTDWLEYPVPDYHIKMSTVLRLVKSIVPDARIQQQVRSVLQHHLCMYIFLMGFAAANHANGTVIKPEDINYVIDNIIIHPKYVVTPPVVPKTISVEKELNLTDAVASA